MNLLTCLIVVVLGFIATSVVSISQNDKELLLFLHNTYREKVKNCGIPGQPGALTMPRMQWHNELAAKAQKWSKQCKVGHDRGEDRKVNGFWWVGQNFAGNPSVKGGFYSWFDEHNKYNFTKNSCESVCGHYTQVVWQESIYLGCGVTQCPKNKFPYGLAIVCNYGPGGNVNGRRPYTPNPDASCGRN
ncbi:Pathogenesis protein PRMS [Fasciola gigantica]|uniref:Pathogenesis protein PRMS n=1 Tax=Fasciola gigantica TaxID=46835 RepID=A0A504YY60_FASGI|nr:Pathogenesis protein PRMS [Fasciola gigantica]